MKTALAVCSLGKSIGQFKWKTFYTVCNNVHQNGHYLLDRRDQEGTLVGYSVQLVQFIVVILFHVQNAKVTATCFASSAGSLMTDAV